jgi:hypothetical protein
MKQLARRSPPTLGEMFIKDGEIELNASRKAAVISVSKADDCRLAPSFPRDQSNVEV